MNIHELNDQELLTLVVLAKYMVHVDGEVSSSEMVDLVSLGEAVGMERFAAALDATKDQYKDPHAVLHFVNSVTRYDAKVLIFILLEELAKGDGVETPEEATLKELRMRWEI